MLFRSPGGDHQPLGVAAQPVRLAEAAHDGALGGEGQLAPGVGEGNLGLAQQGLLGVALALLSVGLVPALTLPTPFEDLGPRAQVPVLWEITARGRGAQGVDYLTLDPQPQSDTTAGLTRPGTLTLALPDESLIWAPSNDVGVNPAAGVGDTPPRLDDAAQVGLVAGKHFHGMDGWHADQ